MKRDIFGIEVLTSDCNINENNVEESCTYAEYLVEMIKTTTRCDPLKGIEKIVIYTQNQETETKKLIADFRNPKTDQFERRERISCNYESMGGFCLENSIHFDAGLFYPLDSYTFFHELGHNLHKYLPWEKKLEITKKHSALKEELIKRIKDGANPSEEENNLLGEYAFLHEFEFSKEDLICFKGYVGILNHIVKILPKDSTQTAKQAYAFHDDDREFFAEMFSMYFHEWGKLVEKGLFDFAGKIIRSP